MSTHKGNVTVEDAADDYDFDADEHAILTRPSTASSSLNPSNSNKKSDTGMDNTNRGGLSPGVESQFEVWLRRYVNQPLLDYVVPEWVSPNSISYLNTGVCWTAFLLSYLSYKYEHLYPLACCFARVIMGVLIFLGISLDCLDGMQARKTGRCSKLGEVLDHSLDAANVPIMGACILMIIYPDVYTVVISAIGGNMVYNAQLVIYRHHHVFVLPPVTGPAAQGMAAAAAVLFGIFFLYVSRHNYFVQVFTTTFAMCGNVAQFQNCYFYGKHLVSSFETSCVMPHIRFVCVMVFHGLLLLGGYLTPPEYMLSSILLAYRMNGKYVLDTLQNFKPFSASHTKENVRREDSKWRWDCIIVIALLWFAALTWGVGEVHQDSNYVTSKTGLPFITDSPFHCILYAGMAAAVISNVLDLVKAAPILATK